MMCSAKYMTTYLLSAVCPDMPITWCMHSMDVVYDVCYMDTNVPKHQCITSLLGGIHVMCTCHGREQRTHHTYVLLCGVLTMSTLPMLHTWHMLSLNGSMYWQVVCAQLGYLHLADPSPVIWVVLGIPHTHHALAQRSVYGSMSISLH
jgi:hypothetical protein